MDIEGHWARTWILDALRFGVMEVSPDNRFYPDLPVSRAEYALFLTNILVDIFHDESLATRYIGEPSRFKDMRSNTATYNAAALCVDRGLMQPRLDGTFGPTENVSGPEALLIIHSLRDQLRMVF
ncbi:MAG TPA: S-layer homology domain-containing protein [Bacteroidetes bacterium]|nr:S-layer homology domain-containing protein [Bacteroidota bacterium]